MQHREAEAYASIRVKPPAHAAVKFARLDLAARMRRDLTNTDVVLACVAVAMRHPGEVAAELAGSEEKERG